jgi:MFS family permease
MVASPGWTLTIMLAIQALVAAAALTVPVLAPVLGPVFNVPGEFVGVYVALIYVGAMLGSLTAGGWIIRFGAVRVSQIGLALCGLGLACNLFAMPVMAIVGAVLIGCGYGPVTPASSHLLIKTTPPQRLSFVFSVKQTGVPLGGILAGLCAPKLNEWVGWQGVLLAVVVACAACIGAAELFRRELDSDRRPHHSIWAGSLRKPLALVFSRRPLALLAGSSLTFSAVQLSFTAYLVIYLHDSLGYSLVAAGVMLSVAQAAGVLGRITWGWFSDRFLGAVAMLTVLAMFMGVGGWALALLPQGVSSLVLGVILIVFGSAAVGWNGVFLAEVARQAPVDQVGLATGGSLTCTFLGVVLGPPLFGAIVSMSASYRLAFAVIVLPAVLFGVLLILQRRHFSIARK